MNNRSDSFRQRRRDTTVDLLVGAAETAIARVGYDAVTMNEIATEAGCANGSWDPVDRWGFEGGRVYATAINALTLEVYYRYDNVFGVGKKREK